MRVFVYEFFTGGGAGELPQVGAEASLLVEAAAMVTAVTQDFAALPGVQVVTTRNRRLPPLHPAGCEVAVVARKGDDRDEMVRLASGSDWTVLIAPETDGALLARARLVVQAGGRLLSPGPAFIEVAGDKQLTAEALGDGGVPVPQGRLVTGAYAATGLSFPMVIKPLDGCGSQQVRLIKNSEELPEVVPGRWRIEEYAPGMPVSVSILCGGIRNWPLNACEQRLSGDGCFSYLGGRLLLRADLNRRARDLALRAIGSLPPTVGYVGVDLVLGEAADGSGDRVIEVNPRLTTSYVGLRAASLSNLAAAMLAVACGNEPVLSFRGEEVEFTAAGEILAAGFVLTTESQVEGKRSP